tara:strand:- start:4506 stop:5486 length:981 start_codon:yes stop_codon:yes gene_type:complete
VHILLTGGAGYIGSHACLALLDAGHKVTVIDNLSTGHKELIPTEASFLQCNINENDKISNLIRNNNFDALIHFAGFIQVEESVKNPKKYFENNTDNSIKLFETCYKNNLINIIFSSTAAAYGNQETSGPILETNKIQPLNPYGESKVRTENYLLNANKFNFIILRYFNVAGADLHLRTGLISKKPTHLIKIASEVAVGKRDKIKIFGKDYNTPDGTAIRDYIHVTDLADIHLKSLEYLIKNLKSNIFNCGYGKGFSVKEVIDTANKITNNSIKYEFGNRRPGDAESLISDVSKLQNAINWKPHYNNLETIIESSIKWEKQLYAKNL